MRNHNSPFDQLMVIATALSGKGKNFALLCILCTPLIIMVSCRKENEENIPNPQGNNGAGISATYVIQVFDNQMQALNGVKVRLAGTEGFTETDGTLLLSADNWPTGSLTLKATRTGFFKKIHTIDSRPGVHTVRIVLQEDVLAGSFNASVGGMVNLPQGGTITFTAGSIIDFSGEPFQGIVNVFASYLDPTSSLSWDYMPNAYLGKSLDGNEYFLENHGAIIAELRDGMGMPLQIADNYTATLSIPHGNFEQGSPPPTLPLYSFNESQGIWLEEGLAELSGNYYTGEVGHFSFWMCPYYYDHHFISGSLACAGTALGSTEVSVYNQWGAFLGSVSSDNGGGFSGMVPEGMPLTLRVNDPCGGEVLSEAIGPFFESDYMEPIDVCAGNANYSSVSGVAEDCDGSGIPGALCFIQSNGILDVLTANASGEFQGSVLFCASSVQFSAVGYNPLSNESSVCSGRNYTGTEYRHS